MAVPLTVRTTTVYKVTFHYESYSMSGAVNRTVLEVSRSDWHCRRGGFHLQMFSCIV
jgi:hypothetical protein